MAEQPLRFSIYCGKNVKDQGTAARVSSIVSGNFSNEISNKIQVIKPHRQIQVILFIVNYRQLKL